MPQRFKVMHSRLESFSQVDVFVTAMSGLSLKKGACWRHYRESYDPERGSDARDLAWPSPVPRGSVGAGAPENDVTVTLCSKTLTLTDQKKRPYNGSA